MITTVTKLSMAALALAIAPLAANADPVEWPVGDGGNGHYYEVIPFANMDWESANADLSANRTPINLGSIGLRGYLATITSSDEHDFIENLRQESAISPPEAWVGGYQEDCDAGPNVGWVWLNNEGAFVYTNWLTGEPNDANGGECHLAIGLGGQDGWNDEVATGNIGGYIVEYEVVVEARNDPTPGGPDDPLKASSGVPKNIDVLGNDTVPAGVATVEIFSDPVSGGASMAEVQLDNSITYTSRTNFEGTDTFEYKVTDINGAFAVATVSIDVSSKQSVLAPGLNQLIFNQALNPAGNNPLTAGYQQVLNGGEVVINCCRVLDTREGAGNGKKYGDYLPIDFDLGVAMADTLTNPSCATVPAVPQGTALLRPWQRGVPESMGLDSDDTAREHDLGVCLIQSNVESRGVVFTAEQAQNVLGYKLNYSITTLDNRPFTVAVSVSDSEVDAPYAVPITAETDESQSGKRFSDNVIMLNTWDYHLHNDVYANLSRLAAALKGSIEAVKLEGCVENNAGFLDSLLVKVQSAKGNMQKNGNPNAAVTTLNDATRQAMLIAPFDTIGDPYGLCPGNPQGLFVGRLMALKFAACSKLQHPTTSANSLDGACVIEPDIRAALPPLPGF